MLDQHVLGSLEACNTWKNYTCMYNATTYFKFFVAKECIKSCETVNYNVVERVQHLVPSIWVRSACMNRAPQISSACLSPQNGKMRNLFLRVFYGSGTILQYEEVKIYDFSTILAAVGGSLGLFLGFSCFQCGLALIHFCDSKSRYRDNTIEMKDVQKTEPNQ